MLSLNNIKAVYILSLTILFLSSCDGGRIFDENISLSHSQWPINDVKSFSFEIKDTTIEYNVLVNVRNTSEYSYRNLYLFVEMTSPSNKFFVDTFEVKLADNKGKWMGSGIGNIWQNQVSLLNNVKLLESGMYRINIIQGMRHDTLKAISDIGVRVEKTL